MKQPLILVVDDEQDIAEIVCELLQGAGYATVEAHDGKRALEQCEHHHPNGIVLDIKIPEIDGTMVIRKLKGSPAFQKIPIIVLTATQIVQESKEELQRLGVFMVISKPFEPEVLVDTIRKAVPQE